MKDIFLTILKEVGIGLAILVVLAAVTVFAFSSQLPFDEEVPKGDKYVEANLDDYSVSSTDRISEINQITITHETNQGQIISAENEVRIQTGKYTPFGTIGSTTDLPSEKVGVTVKVSDSKSNNKNNDSSEDEEAKSNSGNEKLDYPAVSEKDIQKIAEEESESSESAAKRRMGNVE